MSKRVQVARQIDRGCYLLSCWLRNFGTARLGKALTEYVKRAEDKVYSAEGEAALAHSIYLQSRDKAKEARENLKRIKKEVDKELWLG